MSIAPTPGDRFFPHRHLLTCETLTAEEITSLLDVADKAADPNRQVNKKRELLRGRTLINLFFEASTRTQASFELAAKRLGADVLNMNVSTSSMPKGETLIDTAQTLNAMRPDIIVVRHHAVRRRRAVVAEGRLLGDQCRRRRASAPDPGAARCADHAPRQGPHRGPRRRHLRRCGPQPCRPLQHRRAEQARREGAPDRALDADAAAADSFGVEVFTDMREGLAGADIVMMLRMQRERMQGAFVPSTREYYHFFGLDEEKLARAKPDAMVMHPGPINRGVEIASTVADGARSVIQRAGRDGRRGPHGGARGARPPSAEPVGARAMTPERAAPHQPTVFINARLIDPASGRDEPGGLLVRDGQIADFGRQLRRNAPDGAEVVDCRAHVLCPGLIDMQVFIGEPGYEHRETLRTAGEAAAAGGVTTIVVMPDTNPVIDQVALVDFIQRRARDNCIVNVHTWRP